MALAAIFLPSVSKAWRKVLKRKRKMVEPKKYMHIKTLCF